MQRLAFVLEEITSHQADTYLFTVTITIASVNLLCLIGDGSTFQFDQYLVCADMVRPVNAHINVLLVSNQEV